MSQTWLRDWNVVGHRQVKTSLGHMGTKTLLGVSQYNSTSTKFCKNCAKLMQKPSIKYKKERLGLGNWIAEQDLRVQMKS